MANYENLTIEELEAEINAISAQQRDLKTTKIAIQGVLSQKIEAAEAKRKLDRMNPGEKEAMLQILRAEGIGSGEGFGNI